ncbi:AraC family transcriptional regulator [Microbulbifer sp. SAOS-129_SWC]|uniref:helix-turn-helix domain-containing protein n=1 Tax=Microbulbifer sp. SAOS-129_SWC TaxID=3145235 RepID=UPI003217C679
MGETKAIGAARIEESLTGVPGFRLLYGRNVTFAQPRSIVHADYAIKLTTRGCGAPLWYRGAHHPPCATGEPNLFSPFNPLVAGTSETATDFTTLLIEPKLVATALTAPGSAAPAPDSSQLPFVHRKHIARQLLTLADAPGSGAEAELQVSKLLEQLFAAPTPSVLRAATTAVERARECILDNLATNIPMMQLERESGLGRFQLIRNFRQQYGLPPTEYRIRARLALARRLLARGHSQADAAHSVGFYDQSHFHRHFRRLQGFGPGQFQRSLGLRIT